MFFTKFANATENCTEYVDGADPTAHCPTKHEVKVQEATLKFELDNMHLKIKHCHVCRENHMNQVKEMGRCIGLQMYHVQRVTFRLLPRQKASAILV